ncbi:J domain-containing protein [Desulfovibrio sp.]|uniref:J domain-containing protein n=1 Tax=Desulfovibrio sp. TaxID=885 RepID=UPI0025B945EA|nr:J domain-containing protein [Desulfovibrio sp.]MCI7568029.1 J domain-containing protein [Desulfovibrio sp.]
MQRPSRKLSLKECYDILKIDKHADLETLKSAYRKRAFELHPDLHPDNPDAGRQFQRLNEAYVALSAVLKPAAENTGRKEGGAEPKGGRAQEEKTREAPRQDDAAGKSAADDTSDNTDRTDKTDKADKTTHAYAEEEVLRDLLNDPFARRVFEDIYSELHRQDAERAAAEAAAARKEEEAAGAEPRGMRRDAPPAKERRVDVSWLKKGPRKGLGLLFKNGVTGWLRHQIDEEQSFSLPTSMLLPGSRIRLRIRQGISGELVTVEITLPHDFIPGKPVRLRGLGKRIGPWQGDLYLTLTPQ